MRNLRENFVRKQQFIIHDRVPDELLTSFWHFGILARKLQQTGYYFPPVWEIRYSVELA